MTGNSGRFERPRSSDPKSEGSTRRKRAFRPKTRTGCLTCRKRHLKCGEQKPACLNCEKSGWKCDGYSLVVLMTPTSPGGPSEPRAIQFFVERTGPQTACYFDLTFWDDFVIRTALSVPVIEHLVAAVSGIDESLHISVHDEPGRRRRHELKGLSLRHCNGAVQWLLKHGQGLPRSIVITACMLFFRYDMLNGSVFTALKHLLSAQYLVDEAQGPARDKLSPQERQPLDEIICPCVRRLNVRSNVFELWAKTDRPILHLHDVKVPEIFRGGVQGARQCLGAIVRSFMDNINLLSGEEDISCFEKLRSTAQILLQDWRRCYHNLEVAVQSKSAIAAARNGSLEVMDHFVLGMVLQTAVCCDEMAYDHFLEDFRHIVEGCISACGDEASSKRCQQLVGVHYEASSITPLSFVACHCRDPTIRKKAIDTLRAISCKPSMGHCATLADIFEHLMQYENGLNAGQDSQMQHRVHLIDWHYSADRGMVIVRYVTGRFTVSTTSNVNEWVLPLVSSDDPELLNGALFQGRFTESLTPIETFLQGVSLAENHGPDQGTELRSDIDPAVTAQPSYREPLFVGRPLCLYPFPFRDVEECLRDYADRLLRNQGIFIKPTYPVRRDDGGNVIQGSLAIQSLRPCLKPFLSGF